MCVYSPLTQQAQATWPPSSAKYRNTLEAFTSIYRTEGFQAFYKGLLPSLMGVCHVAVQFPLYEKAKSWAGESDAGALGPGRDHAEAHLQTTTEIILPCLHRPSWSAAPSQRWSLRSSPTHTKSYVHGCKYAKRTPTRRRRILYRHHLLHHVRRHRQRRQRKPPPLQDRLPPHPASSL